MQRNNRRRQKHRTWTGSLWLKYPHTRTRRVRDGGRSARRTNGQQSEVGHLNIGAGRVVYQELTRVTKSIRRRRLLPKRSVCCARSQNCLKQSGKALHILLGLCYPTAVCTATLTHIVCVGRDRAQAAGIGRSVFLHCFMDGRDVPPQSGSGFRRGSCKQKLQQIGIAEALQPS